MICVGVYEDTKKTSLEMRKWSFSGNPSIAAERARIDSGSTQHMQFRNSNANKLTDSMSENIKCWANGDSLNRQLALERVIRVLKSFGKEKKDIDFVALQKAIEDLPYPITI